VRGRGGSEKRENERDFVFSFFPLYLGKKGKQMKPWVNKVVAGVG
jgi:hypothetical protein